MAWPRADLLFSDRNGHQPGSPLMSRRLYYEDAYKRQFKARVIQRLTHENRPALVLDGTYFYPASGGQPADRGQLNEVTVSDVFIRLEDGAVVHVLDDELWSDEVTGRLDWSRRFDHMQQHTGQHILSQAFLQIANVETVSFHLGQESCTIDLSPAALTPAQVENGEQLANQIVWDDRPVAIRFVNRDEARTLPLRQLPPREDDHLRLVEIADFDLTACGGTHVSRTGAVGQIKILRVERRRESWRLEFCCGQRALVDYRLKNGVTNRLAARLTVGIAELDDAVGRLQAEVKEANRQLRRQQTELLAFEVERLRREGRSRGGATLIIHVYSGVDAGYLRRVAAALVQDPTTIAFLGLAGPKAQLVLGRGASAPGAMNQLLKPALRVLGSAAGGGSATMAQGGGPAADEARVAQALKQAEKLLLAQL